MKIPQALSRFLLLCFKLFLVTSAIIGAFSFYNIAATVSVLPLIPTEPINWVITAPYGIVSLFLVWRFRRETFVCIGALILFIGWIQNTRLFYPADGSASSGYELISGIVLYLAEAAAIVFLMLVANWFGKDRSALRGLLFGTIAMAVFGAVISFCVSPGQITTIVNSTDHYWWMFAFNLVFLARIALAWEQKDGPREGQTKINHQHEIQQEKQAA